MLLSKCYYESAINYISKSRSFYSFELQCFNLHKWQKTIYSYLCLMYMYLLNVCINLAENRLSFPCQWRLSHYNVVDWNGCYFFATWHVPLLWDTCAGQLIWNFFEVVELKPLNRLNEPQYMGTLTSQSKNIDTIMFNKRKQVKSQVIGLIQLMRLTINVTLAKGLSLRQGCHSKN